MEHGIILAGLGAALAIIWLAAHGKRCGSSGQRTGRLQPAECCCDLSRAHL